MTTPTDAQIVEYARKYRRDDLPIHVEKDAEVSRSDGGTAWVQAWILVDLADMREET